MKIHIRQLVCQLNMSYQSFTAWTDLLLSMKNKWDPSTWHTSPDVVCLYLQGWAMDWNINCLAVYEFKQSDYASQTVQSGLKHWSIQRMDFLNESFNELIPVSQLKNCFSQHCFRHRLILILSTRSLLHWNQKVFKHVHTLHGWPIAD